MYVKKSRRAIRRRTRFFVIIAVVAAAAVGVYFLLSSGLLSASGSLVDMEARLPQTSVASKQGVVCLSESGMLSLQNFEGETAWTLQGDQTQDKLTLSDAMIATYNDSSATFLDYNRQQLFSVAAEGEIEGVCCGIASAIVMDKVTDDNGARTYFLRMYSMEGENTGSAELPSKSVLSMGMYGEGDMIWVLSLDSTGVVPVSYITTYKADGTITGSIGVDSQLLEKVVVTDTQIFASGTNSLAAYSYFGEAQDDELIYGWQPFDCSVSASDMVLLYKTRESSGESLSSVKVMRQDMSDVMIYFPEGVQYCCVGKSGVYAFANYNIYVYNIEGELVNTIELEKPIASAAKLNDSYAAIWDNETTWLIKTG